MFIKVPNTQFCRNIITKYRLGRMNYIHLRPFLALLVLLRIIIFLFNQNITLSRYGVYHSLTEFQARNLETKCWMSKKHFDSNIFWKKSELKCSKSKFKSLCYEEKVVFRPSNYQINQFLSNNECLKQNQAVGCCLRI